MANKNKIRELLARLDAYEGASIPDAPSLTEGLINEEISKLKEGLKNNPVLRSLEKMNQDLSKFRKDFDLRPITQMVREVSSFIEEREKVVVSNLESKLSTLKEEIARGSSTDKIKNVLEKLSLLQEEVTEISKRKVVMPDFNPQIQESERKLKALISSLEESLVKDIKSTDKSNSEKYKKIQEQVTEAINSINRLRNVVASQGGGSMNRQIKIGGVDYLTRYTDINLIAGANVSIAVANSDTNKRVNVTISASGGAGVTFETPVGTVNDTNTIFTVSNTPSYINVNGLIYTEGNGIYVSYVAGTITLNTPVGTGGFIISAH